jgi:hypothetical protein
MVQTRNQSGITTVVPSQVIPLSISDFYFIENDRDNSAVFQHLISDQVTIREGDSSPRTILKSSSNIYANGFKGIYPTKFFALLGE